MDSLFRSSRVKLSTLTNLSHLTKGTKDHLKNVYSCLTIALLAAGIGAYLNMTYALINHTGILHMFFMIGLMSGLAFIPHKKENFMKRLGLLLAIGCFIGMETAPLLRLVIMLDPTLITTAFFTASTMFLCFTLSALFARRRSFLYLGGILGSLLMISLLGAFAIYFTGSFALYKFHVYLGALISCGFIVYDTQIIVERHMNGDDDFIMHAVHLFIDFVNLFRTLLQILAVNDSENKRRRRN